MTKKDKVEKVMREWKAGTLTSHGRKVTDYDQAVAIALSEAGLSKKYAEGGGIGFIPMDLQDELHSISKRGGVKSEKDVIGILNAIIDSGLTDKDLETKPTRTGTQYELVLDKKTSEVWAKVKANYEGDLKGNQYFSTLYEIIKRNNSNDNKIIERYKPFKKISKEQNIMKEGGNMNKYAKGGSIDTPKIYVADLEAYNNGKLVGEWLDLSDFEDGEEVSKEISKLLKKWGAEEYAIHDVENVPSSIYSEYMGEEDFDKIIKIYKASEENDLPYEVISEIMLQYEPEDLEEWISDHYEGHFDNDTDLAYNVVESIGSVSDLGEKTTEMYFDYDKFGRDLAINDEWEGDFDSDEDRGYDYVENMGGVSELGERTIDMYFDYEKFGRDLAINDYIEIEDGYYFRTPRYAKGGLTNERRYVNKSQDYEVRYAKNRLKRTGYKSERKFAVGGEIGNTVTFSRYGERTTGRVTDKLRNGYEVVTDEGTILVEPQEVISFSETPVAKKKRFGFFAEGGEIQSKIDKLQSVVNSKMLPESVKEKARKQIAELEKELHESKETKAEEKSERKFKIGDSVIDKDGDKFTVDRLFPFNKRFNSFEVVIKKKGLNTEFIELESNLHESKETKTDSKTEKEKLKEFIDNELKKLKNGFAIGYSLKGDFPVFYNRAENEGYSDREVPFKEIEDKVKEYFKKGNLHESKETKAEEKEEHEAGGSEYKYLVWEDGTHRIISKHPSLSGAEKYAKELADKNKGEIYHFGSTEKYERFKAEEGKSEYESKLDEKKELNSTIQKLYDIEAKAEDLINYQSGGIQSQSIDKIKKYVEYINKEVSKLDVPFGSEIYDTLQDENAHSLNLTLGLLGFYKNEKDSGEWARTRTSYKDLVNAVNEVKGIKTEYKVGDPIKKPTTRAKFKVGETVNFNNELYKILEIKKAKDLDGEGDATWRYLLDGYGDIMIQEDLLKEYKAPSKPTTRKAPVKKAVVKKKIEVKKTEPKPKFKVGDVLRRENLKGDGFENVKILAVTGWTGNEHRYDSEFLDEKLNPKNKFATVYDTDLSVITKPKADHKKLVAKLKAKKGQGNNDRGDLINYKDGSTERRKRSESSDKKRTALPLGKRVSADGSIYYENRLNRGDLDKGDKLEKGGEVKGSGWDLNLNW